MLLSVRPRAGMPARASGNEKRHSALDDRHDLVGLAICRGSHEHGQDKADDADDQQKSNRWC